MKNISKEQFERVFESDLQLLNNESCLQCDAKYKYPLIPWLVGSKFQETAERIMFVGKSHTGFPGNELPSGFIDATSVVEDKLWNEGQRAYWNYTKRIAENLYGGNAADYIAFSNAVKCTNVGESDEDSTDISSYQMAHCCTEKKGVIWKEAETIKPKTMIFYTYSFFRRVFENIPIALKGTVVEITPSENRVTCGNKQLGWWERKCSTTWTDNLRILVTGHPQCMDKNEYIERLTNWIRSSHNGPLHPDR